MKNNKKFIILLIAILMVIASCFCGIYLTKEYKKKMESISNEKKRNTFLEEYGEYKPILYTIEKDDNIIYLLGSIHIGLEEMFPLPNEIMHAFNDSEVLVVETDINSLESNSKFSNFLLSIMLLEDGDYSKNYFTEEEFETLKSLLLEIGFPVGDKDHYKPYFYYEMLSEYSLSYTIYSRDNGVDQYFLNAAYKKGQEIKELDDPYEIYSDLFGLSYKTQALLVRGMLKEIETKNIQDEYKKMLKSWINGKIKEYYENEEDETKDFTQEELALYEKYNYVLMSKRNKKMADKVEEFLSTGKKHFYVVGAAHLEFEDSILDILKEKGYEIKKN